MRILYRRRLAIGIPMAGRSKNDMLSFIQSSMLCEQLNLGNEIHGLTMKELRRATA